MIYLISILFIFCLEGYSTLSYYDQSSNINNMCAARPIIILALSAVYVYYDGQLIGQRFWDRLYVQYLSILFDVKGSVLREESEE